jgi:hypothetical protein
MRCGGSDDEDEKIGCNKVCNKVGVLLLLLLLLVADAGQGSQAEDFYFLTAQKHKLKL